MLSDLDIITRFIIAAFIGGLVGYSRRARAAGVRTFALLCFGCTMFTVVSIQNIYVGTVDQTRIIAQIVSGIGFLGLGVIWKQGLKPTGLTTAAAIWVTAALGILVGLGLWLEVLSGTVLTLIILFSKHLLQRLGIDGE